MLSAFSTSPSEAGCCQEPTEPSGPGRLKPRCPLRPRATAGFEGGPWRPGDAHQPPHLSQSPAPSHPAGTMAEGPGNVTGAAWTCPGQSTGLGWLCPQAGHHSPPLALPYWGRGPTPLQGPSEDALCSVPGSQSRSSDATHLGLGSTRLCVVCTPASVWDMQRGGQTPPAKARVNSQKVSGGQWRSWGTGGAHCVPSPAHRAPAGPEG